MDSASAGLKSSALDLLAAMLTGRGPDAARWSENRHLLVLLTTSLAVLVGCGVALLVRRFSAAPRAAQPQPRPLAAKKQDEPETDPDDGRPRITVFFGTQTGTAEGFAKVPPAKAQCSPPVPALHSEFLKSLPLSVCGFCRRSWKRPSRGTTRHSSRWLIWYAAEISKIKPPYS
jgi:hypothetical protein